MTGTTIVTPGATTRPEGASCSRSPSTKHHAPLTRRVAVDEAPRAADAAGGGTDWNRPGAPGNRSGPIVNDPWS